MKIENASAKPREHSDADFLRLHEETRDPNRHYRWVRVDETNSSINKHQMKGYSYVTRDDDVRTVSDPLAKGGDKIMVGDLVLMSCPKEDYERRQREREERTQHLIQSTTIEAEQKAAERGVRVVRDPDHRKER